MLDPALFHGIAVVIDDEVEDPKASVNQILNAIVDAGCHYVALSKLPSQTSLPNLREVAFVVLDWKLYGAELREIEGQGVPPEVTQQNEANIIQFLREFKQIRFAPVFIFTDEPAEKIIERLKHYPDLYDEADPSHILVKDKLEVVQAGLFNELAKWMEEAPSAYVLKNWEQAYEKAKNELFLDFYVKGRLWPLILWDNFEEDGVPPAEQIGRLIARNLASRMSPFNCDLGAFAQLPREIDKAPESYGSVMRKVIEGERFLAENRLDKGSFAPGDIFHVEDGFRINIRPDCDCVPRGNDTADALELYLLRGTEIPIGELEPHPEYGVIPEQDNEAIVFPVFAGKALRFKFRKLYKEKWRLIKSRRIGRLLPPMLTRVQQRYSSYLQHPGQIRLPATVFPTKAQPMPPGSANPGAPPTPVNVGGDQQHAPAQETTPAASLNAPSTTEPKNEPSSPDPKLPGM
jgi:hypothetical protein